MKIRTLAAGAALIALSACTAERPQAARATAPVAAADARIDALADAMVALEVGYNPAAAYFIGVPAPDHRRWSDRSPAALTAKASAADDLLTALRAIDPDRLGARRAVMRAAMIEQLEADRQARICAFELWDVNHMGGWHLALATVAREQPVETAGERMHALERWAALPALIDREIANARLGLSRGYSAPKAVVARVIRQAEGLAAAEPESLPFWAPAERSDDSGFRSEYRRILAGPVRNAFARWRDFLAQEYLPAAREALGVSANPDGAACYRASLRAYTTLDRPPEEVFALGKATVEGNLERVRELGRSAFGTDALPAIVARIKQAPDNRFSSEEELIDFSRAVVARSVALSGPFFAAMPAQEMRVEPFHTYRRGSGGSSYYEGQIDPALPAFYRINSESWPTETRGGAEITAVHEGYPGHHMQISFANTLDSHPVMKLTANSAYVEGWARYSEALAEEADIYRSVYAPMTRRLWPARGMVVDPGLHVLGWSREQVTEYIRASGRFEGKEADDLVDRIAILPGQLTAYDSGGLEIVALRREAEQALGDRFDLRQFHRRVLENGSVPLPALRAYVRAWIAEQAAAAQ